MGEAHDLLVVVRSGTVRDVLVALLPTLATIPRSIEAAFVLGRLDGGVDDVGIGGGDGEADLAHVPIRQALFDSTPRLAGIGRLVDPRARAARQKRPDMTSTLVGGGVEHVGIARVDLDVGDAGVLVDGQHLSPGLPAVGGLVETSLAARGPQGPLGSHIDHVAIAGIDDDLADVLGSLQSHLLPGLSTVGALVDTIAPADVAAADVLTGADPDHIRIRGVDGHAAHRVGGLVVEDRRPGDSRVVRLPDTAGADRYVPGAAIAWADCDVGNSTAHQGRTDAAQREALQSRGGETAFVALRCRVSRNGECDGEK